VKEYEFHKKINFCGVKKVREDTRTNEKARQMAIGDGRPPHPRRRLPGHRSLSGSGLRIPDPLPLRVYLKHTFKSI